MRRGSATSEVDTMQVNHPHFRNRGWVELLSSGPLLRSNPLQRIHLPFHFPS